MAQKTHLALRPILAMLRLLQQVNLGDLPHPICPILLHPRGRRPRLRPLGINWFGFTIWPHRTSHLGGIIHTLHWLGTVAGFV